MNENERRLKREQMKLTTPDNTIEDAGTIRFYVKCNGNAEDVLQKAKEVLLVANLSLQAGSVNDEEWRHILPSWFVNECASEITPEEATQENERRRKLPESVQCQIRRTEKWSLLSWSYWLLPEDRIWIWWGAECLDQNTILVAVEVTDWPFPWDALSWLFRASGAISVDPEE